MYGSRLNCSYSPFITSTNPIFCENALPGSGSITSGFHWRSFQNPTRKRQGFNVIQSVLISEIDGLRIPNAYGQVPLINMSPEKPNPEYFYFVKRVLLLAESKEMYLLLVPTWGDKIDRIFGIGPEIFSETNAFEYGKWLGKKFRPKGKKELRFHIE